MNENEKGGPEERGRDTTRIDQVTGQVIGDQIVHGNVTNNYNAQPPPPSAPGRDWMALYLKTIFDACGALNFKLLAPDRIRLGQEAARLAQVYVDLDTTLALPEDLTLSAWLMQPQTRTSDDEKAGPAREERKLRPVPVMEFVGSVPRLVVTGVPGGGKSTLVAWIALALAEARQGDAAALTRLGPWWKAGQLLPVRVELRRLAPGIRLVPKPNAAKIWRFVQAEAGLTDPERHALENEASRGALFLLDGWDEAADLEGKLAVAEAVLDLIRTAGPKARFLLTSRPYAWEQARTLAATPAKAGDPMGARCRRVFGELLQEWPLVAQVAEFTPDQVKRFVERWYGAIPGWGWLSEKEAAEHAVNLQPQLDRDYLVPLARNPLLLTLLVALDCSNTRLPDDRTELYEQAVELLLKRWNERVGADLGLLEALAIPTLKMSDLRDRLEQVALDAHEAHTGHEGVPDLPRGALLAAFEPLLGDNSEKAKLVVEYVEKRAGLLIAQGARLKDPLFRFVHRTFQEYLAACALRDEHDPGERAARLAEADAYHWREVLRFAARIEGVKRGARLADELVHCSDAPAWLLACPAGVSDWRRAIVAAEQLQEIGLAAVQGNKEAHMVLRRVAGWLAALLDQGGLPVVERAHAGRLLGQLGDPRPGVRLEDGLLDPQDFVRLPPGRFRFAQTSQEAGTEGPFRLSRYPVTVAQYEAFVAAGGYADDGSAEATQRLSRWWSRKGLEWKRREQIAGPKNYSPMFQTPNHPRVGVSWFEAEAFCGWLTEQLRRKGPLTEGDRIGLPSEAQWEWAARWNRETRQADDRRYPWGGSGAEDLAQRCNMRRTGLGQTTAVGLFPSGKADCGAMDLSGNVWEWCADRYDKDESARVVRGGSWYGDDPGNLSCGFRGFDPPESRGGNGGFRCVWVGMSAR